MGIKMMAGDGNGGLGSAVHLSELAPSPAGMAIADFNGDGRADLAIAGYSATFPQIQQVNVQLLLGANVQPPAAITILAGSPQSTPNGSAFSPALQATVKDTDGKPVSNALVTFSSPTLAAPALVVTDSKGIATLK